MALQYKYLDRPKDIDECLKLMQNDIVPLLQAHWDKRGRDFYGKDFNLNTEAFVRLWLSGSFSVVIAYEGEKAVGIFIGLRMIPMNFMSQVLQVETCYGESAEVEKGLYNYIKSIGPILGYDEIWLNTDMNDNGDLLGMKVAGKSEVIRYVSE